MKTQTNTAKHTPTPWETDGIWWWSYLLSNIDSEQSLFRTIICRVQGHRCGVVWYNPTGYEPNMTCKNCGDDLDPK